MIERRVRSIVALGVCLAIPACAPPTPTSAIVSNGQEDVVTAASKAALVAGRAGRPLHVLVVSVKLVDSDGVTGTAPGATFTWAQEDLDKIRWDAISEAEVVDLAAVHFDGLEGANGVSAWCNSSYGPTLAPRFCGQSVPRATAAYRQAPAAK